MPSQPLTALLFAIAFAYLLSWPLRHIFRMGQGPLLQVTRTGSDSPDITSFLGAAFRIGVFYSTVVALVTLGSAGIVSLFNAEPIVMRAAILAALFLVAMARLLSTNYSGNLMQTLFSLSLGVVGAMGFQFIVNRDYAHQIVMDSFGNDPNLVRLYSAGVIVAAATGETIWFLGLRLFKRTRRVSYSLFREYQETFESYEMAAYRGPIERLFAGTVRKSLQDWGGLKEFYWKTWSGEPYIAQALLERVCEQQSFHSSKPYSEMTPKEKSQFEKVAREYIGTLEADGKALVIMPTYPEIPNAPEIVRDILGIKPLQIPDVGSRRYLVTNRRDAIISLPVPADFSHSEDGTISDTGSNFAIATGDPSRVHECLTEFEGLWSTFS